MTALWITAAFGAVFALVARLGLAAAAPALAPAAADAGAGARRHAARRHRGTDHPEKAPLIRGCSRFASAVRDPLAAGCGARGEPAPGALPRGRHRAAAGRPDTHGADLRRAARRVWLAEGRRAAIPPAPPASSAPSRSGATPSGSRSRCSSPRRCPPGSTTAPSGPSCYRDCRPGRRRTRSGCGTACRTRSRHECHSEGAALGASLLLPAASPAHRPSAWARRRWLVSLPRLRVPARHRRVRHRGRSSLRLLGPVSEAGRSAARHTGTAAAPT